MRKSFFSTLIGLSLVWLVGFTNGSPQITVFVDDEILEFDVPPTIIDGRTLVPMRSIFETLNCDVDWDGENRKVIATTEDGDIITLFIDEVELYKNYVVLGEMDVPAKIIDGRTFVPLRAVSEMLNCEVLWVGETYEVFIESEGFVSESSLATNPNYVDDGKPFYTLQIKQNDEVLMRFVAEVANENSLSESQSELIKDKMRAYIVDWRNSYEIHVKDKYAIAKNSFEPFIFEGDFLLTQNNKDYMSYLFKGVIYWNNEEINVTDNFTFKISTNEEVDIDTVVEGMNNSDWEEFYYNSFMAVINKEPSKFYDDAENILKNSFDEVGFYLVPEGIIFYLDEGLIANKSSGIISFIVEFDY